MDIDIERTETNALLTIDPQYADIKAIFYIKVNPIAEDIERAARTIGGGEVGPDSVKRLVESKLEGALRDVAATFALMSLHQEREKFVERVQNLVRQDLAENGLLLESVSITTLKSARQGSFGIDDVFGAQVARANAQVIQKALRERNEIDQSTQNDIARRNASAEQERNEIEQNKLLEIATRNAKVEQETLMLNQALAEARATQQRIVLIKQAEEKSSADQATFDRERAAELARVARDRAIAEAEQEKEQAVKLAEQRKEQAIQLAEQEREREVRRSEVFKQQTIEVADQERRVALAVQQTALEKAEQQRLVQAAEREGAAQELLTVEETSVARREAAIQIISAERDAQREMIARKNEVELVALRQLREASAQAEAAQQLANATRTEAQAAADAERMRAAATQARGQAEADAVRAQKLAEAEGQRALANALAANDFVSQRLELERLRFQSQVAIGTAQAQAMGDALAAMDFKLYGTAETAQQILRLVGLADGLGSLAQNAPAPLRALGERLLDRVAPQPAADVALLASQPLVQRVAALLAARNSTNGQHTQRLDRAIEDALADTTDPQQHDDLVRAQGLLIAYLQLASQPLSALLGG